MAIDIRQEMNQLQDVISNMTDEAYNEKEFYIHTKVMVLTELNCLNKNLENITKQLNMLVKAVNRKA